MRPTGCTEPQRRQVPRACTEPLCNMAFKGLPQAPAARRAYMAAGPTASMAPEGLASMAPERSTAFTAPEQVQVPPACTEPLRNTACKVLLQAAAAARRAYLAPAPTASTAPEQPTACTAPDPSVSTAPEQPTASTAPEAHMGSMGSVAAKMRGSVGREDLMLAPADSLSAALRAAIIVGALGQLL